MSLFLMVNVSFLLFNLLKKLFIEQLEIQLLIQPIFKSHSLKAEGLLLMDCVCVWDDHFRALWLVSMARSQGV